MSAIFQNGWFYIVTATIAAGYSAWGFWYGPQLLSRNAGDEMTKVKIQDSQLYRSPVIVDSPGSQVDNRTTNFILTKQDPQEVMEQVTGVRDSMGLYVDGQKLGTAINPILSEEAGTFTIEQINYTKPWSGPVSFPPMEFRHYLLQIEQVELFAAMSVPSMTASAAGVRGRILSKSQR